MEGQRSIQGLAKDFRLDLSGQLRSERGEGLDSGVLVVDGSSVVKRPGQQLTWQLGRQPRQREGPGMLVWDGPGGLQGLAENLGLDLSGKVGADVAQRRGPGAVIINGPQVVQSLWQP